MLIIGGWRGLNQRASSGWPTLARLILARVGHSSCPFSNFQFPVSIFKARSFSSAHSIFYFRFSSFHCYFRTRFSAIPVIVSCHACVMIPGRKLFRHSAKIPKSKPYTAITVADFVPW